MTLLKLNNKTHDYYIMLGAVIFLTIILRIIFATGFYVTADDHYYSVAAYEISQGQINIPDNHWNARIGNTFSIAAFYWLFGVGEYTATFSTIFYSVLNILVIFLLSRELFTEDNYRLAALLAAIFYAFLPISIAEGSSLSMHQGVVFFMFLSLYFMLVGERTRKTIWYVLSGLAVGVSYLFHETGAYIFIPIALFYLFNKKLEWKALWILVVFILVMAVETAIYHELTGKAFYRQTISLNPLENRNKARVTTEMEFTEKLRSLKPIDNPLNGTLIGDSWFLEPFRWSFLDPANSILYHIMLVISVLLLWRKNRKASMLLLMFAGLYLYIAYGSPNPLSYEPLRRLPRYTLPCGLIAAIIAGYGLCKVNSRPSMIVSVVFLYMSVSLLSMSIKGGEIGQKLHQARHFLQYMSDNPHKHYLTDYNTLNAIEFLSQYQRKFNITAFKSKDIENEINHSTAAKGDHVLLINVAENYSESLAFLKDDRFRVIDKHNRKPRKICHIGLIGERLPGSLCDVSKGGQIYQVLPEEPQQKSS